MYRVARQKLKGPSKALVVQAAGCNASIAADQIDDVIFWEQGIRPSKAQGCVGVLTYREDLLQLFALTEHMTTPRWHFSNLQAHWIVVVRANGQLLGLVVEKLIGWGAFAQRKISTTSELEANYRALAVELDEHAIVDAQFIEVNSIIKTDTAGRYFYV